MQIQTNGEGSELWATRIEIAFILDVRPRQVDNYVLEGIPREKRGRAFMYPVLRCKSWKAERYGQKNGNGNRASLDEVRFRRETAQAEITELELGEKRGQLVRITEVTTQFSRILERLRGKILNIPGRYAPDIVGLKTHKAAQLRLDDVSRDLLADLRSSFERDRDDSPTKGKRKRRAPKPTGSKSKSRAKPRRKK